MRELGLFVAVVAKAKRTKRCPLTSRGRLGHLVERIFRAPAPIQLGVADVTNVATWSGFVYVA